VRARTAGGAGAGEVSGASEGQCEDGVRGNGKWTAANE
jgi:hypothetical protein